MVLRIFKMIATSGFLTALEGRKSFSAGALFLGFLGTTENAGLKNTGPSYRWVENARPVAMERRWYQCCKTEMDVVVRCRKRTRTGNILYAVINSYRKKYTLLTQSELKSLCKIRMHQKSAKNTPFCQNCKRNVFYIILSYYRRTQN